MTLSKCQAYVLANLDRVTTDGARCDTRYELNGRNVSLQMRALLAKGLVTTDQLGRFIRQAQTAHGPHGFKPAAVTRELRALFGQPPER